MAKLDDTLKAHIERLINESYKVYRKEDPTSGLDVLLEAWDLMPDDRENYDEGYMLAKYILYTHYNAANKELINEWLPIFTLCEHTQRNSGESEYLSGRIAIELYNDVEQAKAHFAIANRKSSGRYFTGDGKKYKYLLDKKAIRPTTLKALLSLAQKESKAGNWGYALDLLYDCINIDLMNPLVYLLKGICHYELNELDHAADSLTRAYMLEGLDIFKLADPKYLDFLKTKIQL